ncbi:MAG: DNA-binding response OmpR family regulator [Sulfurimonas sp.]|jgi:DNA-binding response OmpR family regulator|uniref:response regulator transcription factor n=1 Tax=Sulfurimonas sp. TaxID=2022749 RepID=UPI0039E59033
MRSNLTLLYVEDDVLVRENFIQIFQCYFSNVISTDNGIDALELYNKNHIDVAILDISIPGINGLKVATKIRESNSDIVLFIISAYSDKDKLLEAINLRLFGYLVKPVTSKEIDESIQKIIHSCAQTHYIKLSIEYSWNELTQHLLYNNMEIKLTNNESKIVQLLIKNKNNFLKAPTIHELLFSREGLSDVQANNIVQIISRFKKKVLKLCHTQDFFIENCYGLGYKITIS